jgi:hypothetical protein
MTDSTKKPRIRVAEALESSVEGLLHFLSRYFRTGIRVITSPRRRISDLLADRHAARVRFVLPMTYLSIGLFLLSLLGQVAGTQIYDWIWFSDDLAEKVTDTLSKEISLLKVAVQALPGVLVVVVLSVVLRTMLAKRAPRSRRLVPFVLSYAFGAQAWLLFSLVFGFVVLATIAGKWEPPGGAIGAKFFGAMFYLAIFTGLVAALVCPLIFVVSGLRLRLLWRRKKLMATVIMATTGISMLFGHWVILHATILPTQVIKTAKGSTAPRLDVLDIGYSIVGDTANVRISILLANPDTKAFGWETEKFDLYLYPQTAAANARDCKGDSLHFRGIRVIDSTNVVRRYVTVEPSQTQWFEVATTLETNELMRQSLQRKGEWGVSATASLSKKEVHADCAVRTMLKRAS